MSGAAPGIAHGRLEPCNDDSSVSPSRHLALCLALLVCATSRAAAPAAQADEDRAACHEVIARAQHGTLSGARAPNGTPPASRDPADDWGHLDQVASSAPIQIGGRTYLLGRNSGPVYLARVGPDGVESVLCEFAANPKAAPTTYRILSLYERLLARSMREHVSVSLESLERPGLAAARALLDASRRAQDRVPLQFNSDGNVLGEAIQAHRDDVLAFYLDHGVDPNLSWLPHPLVDAAHAPSWHDAPLYTAVRYGTPESIRLLLQYGADPDGTGGIPAAAALTWAVTHGPLANVQLLLGFGADPNLSGATAPVVTLLDNLFRGAPLADVNAAAIRELLLHGADPNPWLSTGFEMLARARHRQDLLQKELSAPNRIVQTDWLTEALASPGYVDPRTAALLKDAARVRDSSSCSASMTAPERPFCLPNAVRDSVSALDSFSTQLLGTHPGLANTQVTWMQERDRSCRLKDSPTLSKAGWLSYVLDDQLRALCVLALSRRRLTELGSQGAGPSVAH
jgi:hypothetical protein